MLDNLAGAIVSGTASLIGSGVNAFAQDSANKANIQAQERINKANLEHANYWNEKNYALASEAQQAQFAQQNWANEQYIENRDYERQLQQEVFHREDTALQRSLQQAVDAGFSPLTALGINTGTGSIISNSSAPGSMVSNNQASVQGAGQIAPRVEALTTGDGFGQIGAMLATMAESESMRNHQSDMQTADFAHKLLEMDKSHFADKVLKQMENDFLRDRDNQLHLYTISEKLQDKTIQEEILKIIHRHESDLQNDQQAHQADLQNDQQAHQTDLQNDQQSHQADLQKAQQDWQSSNLNNQGSGRGLHDIVNDLISVLAEGDGRVANWLRENQQVITLIIEGAEYTAGLATGAVQLQQNQQRLDNDTTRVDNDTTRTNRKE